MDFTYFGVFDPDRGPKMDPIEPDSEWLDAFNIWTPKWIKQNILPQSPQEDENADPTQKATKAKYGANTTKDAQKGIQYTKCTKSPRPTGSEQTLGQLPERPAREEASKGQKGTSTSTATSGTASSASNKKPLQESTKDHKPKQQREPWYYY